MTQRESLADETRALELALLEPEVRGSRQRLEALLADDFLEFGSSGLRRMTFHQGTPASGLEED